MTFPSSKKIQDPTVLFSSKVMSTPETPPAGVVSVFPNDVALQCLARIPLWHHRNLYKVSTGTTNAWLKSLLQSPDLFSTRSNLNCTQRLLYLTLRSSSYHDSWYILYRIPEPNPNATGQDFKILAVNLPPIPVQYLRPSSFVLLGTKIYAFGGYVHGEESYDMWVLDCRFNTWEQGPSMQMEEQAFAYGVVDGKIYATDSLGGKAFDPVSGRWEEQEFEKWFYADYIAGGRFYLCYDDDRMLEYNPRKKEWDDLGNNTVEDKLDLDCYGRNACVIDGLLYFCDSQGTIIAFDVERGVQFSYEEWFFPSALVANVGGRLGVVWMEGEEEEEEEEGEGEGEGEGEENGKEIWYAEIDIKVEDGDLWGRLRFADKVLSAPSWSKFLHFAGVSL